MDMDKYKITEDEFAKASIERLATHPNTSTAYGDSKMTAAELKKRFDAQGRLFRKKFNDFLAMIPGGNDGDSLAAKILTGIAADHTLKQMFLDIVSESGAFASYLSVGDQTLLQKLAELDKENLSLEEKIDLLDKADGKLEERLSDMRKEMEDRFLSEDPTKVSEHNVDQRAHSDIRLLIDGLNARLNAVANSEDVDLDQLAELVAYIKSNRSLIEEVTTGKVNVTDIINDLTTNAANKPLSAAQGVALKALIEMIAVPNVSRYGATGDGDTDDTVAFQSALAENRTVYVPGGTYKLTKGLVIGDNCELELAQDAVLDFRQVEGNCITLGMSGTLKGNHATIKVPYEFGGNVVFASSTTTENASLVPPFERWDPQWKSGRYVTDLNICKADLRGFHYSVDGTCSGTAVYISADGDAVSSFMWGIHYSGLRIAGAFSYGIRAVNFNGGWVHEMRVDAFIDACEIGVSLEDCNNAYVSAVIQPRKAFTTEEKYVPYAKQGIRLIRSKNVDLSGSRVWDWNADNTLWTEDGEYQHLAMYDECRGLILNDFLYYEQESTDIRKLIYTDMASNLEQMTILQEPFSRWFKPIGNEPYFSDGYTEKKLVTKEELDRHFDTDVVKSFTDVLATAINQVGDIYNGIGYKKGVRIGTNGFEIESPYYISTGFIPCKKGSTIWARELSFMEGDQNCRVLFYDADFNLRYYGDDNSAVMLINRGLLLSNGNTYVAEYEALDNGFKLTLNGSEYGPHDNTAYVRFVFYKTQCGKNPMMSVDEEIKYTVEGFLVESVKVKDENISGKISSEKVDAEWMATKKYVSGGGIVWNERTLSFQNTRVLVENSIRFEVDAGIEYDVYWNGSVYPCFPKTYDGELYMGNGSIAHGTSVADTGEPFCFTGWGEELKALWKSNSTTESITVKVTVHTVYDYNRLPDVFIPKSVATSSELNAHNVNVEAHNDIRALIEALSTRLNTHNVNTEAHNDIRLLIEALSTRVNTIANSDDVDLDQLAELVAYIKANRSLIESVTTSKVNVTDIINNLTTNVTNKPLSAAQGVALKALIDAITVPTKLSELDEDSLHRTVTDDEKERWNAGGALADVKWLATSTDHPATTEFIPEQKLSSGLWENLQYELQPGVVYDVYINGMVYACTARENGRGAILGNNTELTLNEYPFCISWAGGTATGGMFFKDSTISFPINLKVTDHAYTEYNKLPEEFLPDIAARKSDIPQPLIGTTNDVKPSEVAAALADGRTVAITYENDAIGNITFTSFVVVDDTVSSSETIITTEHQLSGSISTEKWSFISVPVSSGGGSDIDVVAEVGQTIIVEEVDGNGKPTKWKAADYQPRTHWQGEKVMLPEGVFEGVDDPNIFNHGVQIMGLVEGHTYIVNFEGVEYTCVAERGVAQFGDSGVDVIYVGNSAGVGGSNNSLPFFIADAPAYNPPMGVVVVPMDGSYTLSVTGVDETYTIPDKYVNYSPAFPYYIEVTGSGTDDDPHVCNETVANVEAIFSTGREIKLREYAMPSDSTLDYIVPNIRYLVAYHKEFAGVEYDHNHFAFIFGGGSLSKYAKFILLPQTDGTYLVQAFAD